MSAKCLAKSLREVQGHVDVLSPEVAALQSHSKIYTSHLSNLPLFIYSLNILNKTDCVTLFSHMIQSDFSLK